MKAAARVAWRVVYYGLALYGAVKLVLYLAG
jgi:hypothetical protein